MAGRSPPVAVVMPVFDALPYLDAAIASVLGQTFADFEFAIYDDCSTDGSYECALAWAERDARITLRRAPARAGPCASAAAAAAMARSEFVARMDADDIAMPDRLAYQLAAMRAHPEAVLIGSTFEMIDGAGRVFRAPVLSHTRGSSPPIAHTSIFYRRSAFDAAGGYRANTDYFEDQDLYRRIARQGALLISERPLVQFRFAGQHNRLRDEREAVLDRINAFYRPVSDGSRARTLSPTAIYAVGVLSALGLKRPRMLRLVAARMDFREPAKALGVLGFIAIAELWPRLARKLNWLFAHLRAMRVAPHAGDNIHTWVFTK